MQYERSRQDVTGLVVNTKVNTRNNYWRNARAMAHSLFTTGAYFRVKHVIAEDGEKSTEKENGSIEELNGVLGFIDSIDRYNKLKHGAKGKDLRKLNCREETYRKFLFYKHFITHNAPVILCEGKTDSIHLKVAIKSLSAAFPNLVETLPSGEKSLKIRFFNRSKSTDRLLSLSGGTGELNPFVSQYSSTWKKFHHPKLPQPVIVLLDHDIGGKGSNNIFGKIKSLSGKAVDDKEEFYHLGHNLYAVVLHTVGGKDTMIENLHDPKLLTTKLRGKTFTLKTRFDNKKHYGKFIFAKTVVEKNYTQIDFSGFSTTLERISKVIDSH